MRLDTHRCVAPVRIITDKNVVGRASAHPDRPRGDVRLELPKRPDGSLTWKDSFDSHISRWTLVTIVSERCTLLEIQR